MITVNDIARCFFLATITILLCFRAILEIIWMFGAIVASVIYCKIATWNYDESHGLLHHITVAIHAVRIAFSENVDLHNTTLLAIAALVHDSVDHKYCKTDAEKEAANAQLMNFLVHTVGTWDAGRIYIWITHSSYSKEKDRARQINEGKPNKKTLGVPSSEHKYTRILADADRIDSISDEIGASGRPMGIERCYQFSKNAKPHLSDTEIWKKVCEHCFDKLNTLDEWILTSKGKELAQPGIKAVNQWYNDNVSKYTLANEN